MAVLLSHHPRKAQSADGRAARGSGALLGFVDVLIEMTWRGRPGGGGRARRLRAWSRYPGTPQHLLMELTADGSDYQAVDEAAAAEDDIPASLPEGLRLVLEGADRKLTRQEILDGWLPDFLPAPDGGTLCRWLLRAAEQGQVCREGSGRRNDPFRYWLAEQERRWRQHPFYEIKEELEAQVRRMKAEGTLPPED
jgi:hypothetical protein